MRLTGASRDCTMVWQIGGLSEQLRCWFTHNDCCMCHKVEDGGEAGSVATGGLNSAQLTLVQLLAVLRGYLRCVPETFAEARFDTSRLLPEACSTLSDLTGKPHVGCCWALLYQEDAFATIPYICLLSACERFWQYASRVLLEATDASITPALCD